MEIENENRLCEGHTADNSLRYDFTGVRLYYSLILDAGAVVVTCYRARSVSIMPAFQAF